MEYRVGDLTDLVVLTKNTSEVALSKKNVSDTVASDQRRFFAIMRAGR